MLERTRPLRDGLLAQVDGFSFPSSHSSGAQVADGLLAYLVRQLLPRRWHLPRLLVAVALVLSIGSSRLFLQAHFSCDVVAGFWSGSVWLTLCIARIALSPKLSNRTLTLNQWANQHSTIKRIVKNRESVSARG